MPTQPTIEQLREIAHVYGLHLSDADLESFRGLMSATFESYRRIDQLTEPALPVRYARTGGYRPTAEDNPMNAWYQKCSITGAPSGPLAGKRIAIKDNVCVAGVPMMNGSSVLEGYVPEFDATIVTRILDAGGEIVGKAVCESLCFSGSSFTADTGPVLNPHHPAYSAGGSSSGSAALVVAGECDMAIGGDQGGSIVIPSCWCGAYGLKPTYGLVPYTGIFPIELTLDHTGPIAATTADVALLLEAIAGEDGLDPRQNGTRAEAYTSALRNDTEGIRIGIVNEGFRWPDLFESNVDELVEAAALRFSELGSQVSRLSIPMHRDGKHIWNAIMVEGAAMLMVRGNSMGSNWKGHYCISLLDAYARGRITRADDFFETLKLTTLLGHYMQERYHGRYYAKAQNLARTLTKAYDDALQTVDLLVMPTTPIKATRIPRGDAPREEKIHRASEMNANNCPFNVTGHPVMTVPCGLSEGLPVGMMLVGRKGEDATVLRAAHAFEQIRGYTVRPKPLSALSAQ
ncbi:MAG TPA: amidase [Ktedonobacteraceae bacterium]